MNRLPMTAAGYDRLHEELKTLKAVDRPGIIEAIAEARGHGDLSENAEYHSARERQGFIEGRIADLEDKLSRVEVIDLSKMTGDTVKFGATVTVADEDTGEKTSYQIVGEYEANIDKNLLANTAPISRALMGKKAGDSVEVRTPKGIRAYKILKVGYK